MERHQRAIAQAAEAAAAERARQREELIASMSPEELARAAAAHAEMAAVGTMAFGTPAASQLAGLVHQTHVQGVAQAAADRGQRIDEAEVDLLMSLSPQELAVWDQEAQGMAAL